MAVAFFEFWIWTTLVATHRLEGTAVIQWVVRALWARFKSGPGGALAAVWSSPS